MRVTDDGQKQMITGHLTVFRDGKEIDKAYPGKWFYRGHEQEPVSQVAIRRSAAEDLYIVMPGFDLQDQSVTLQVVINPLVDWIWVGFGDPRARHDARAAARAGVRLRRRRARRRPRRS